MSQTLTGTLWIQGASGSPASTASATFVASATSGLSLPSPAVTYERATCGRCRRSAQVCLHFGSHAICRDCLDALVSILCGIPFPFDNSDLVAAVIPVVVREVIKKITGQEDTNGQVEQAGTEGSGLSGVRCVLSQSRPGQPKMP